MLIDATLLKRLQQNDPSLERLNLSNQSLNDEDIIQLAKALSQNTTLASLDISGNQIAAEGAKALSQNITLTSLDISYNLIGDEGAKALSQNTTLASLTIYYNRIGAEGAKALSQNTTLTSLDMSYNQIGAEGAKALSQNTTLTLLNISSNQIGAEGAKAFSQNTTLTSLDISRNRIGDEGAKALSQNTTLTSLTIYYNRIGAEGAKTLSQNTTLTSLYISDNQIGDEGAKALSQNTTLISLDISRNQIGDEAKQLIAKMLERNKQHQQNYRNRFIRTLHKGISTVNELTKIQALPLPPELIYHIGSYLDGNFYLQLAAIKHPARFNKTAQQIYQCALFFLHQFAKGQVAEGILIERKPKTSELLSHRQHFFFKPGVTIPSGDEPAAEPKTKPMSITSTCFMQ